MHIFSWLTHEWNPGLLISSCVLVAIGELAGGWQETGEEGRDAGAKLRQWDVFTWRAGDCDNVMGEKLL